MRPDLEHDLVRIATYSLREDAEAARAALLHHQVAGVLVIGQAEDVKDEVDRVVQDGFYDLMVPVVDAARVISLIDKSEVIPNGQGAGLSGANAIVKISW